MATKPTDGTDVGFQGQPWEVQKDERGYPPNSNTPRWAPACLRLVFAAVVLVVVARIVFWRTGVGIGQRLRAEVKYARWRGLPLRGEDFESTTLQGVDFSGLDLARCIFTDCNLEGANFDKANLEKCDFEITQLDRSHFRHANLRGARLTTDRLNNSDLTGANLTDANMSQAQVRGADLRDTKLDGAVLDGALYSATTKWPPGFDPIKRGARLVPDEPPSDDDR